MMIRSRKRISASSQKVSKKLLQKLIYFAEKKCILYLPGKGSCDIMEKSGHRAEALRRCFVVSKELLIKNNQGRSVLWGMSL